MRPRNVVPIKPWITVDFPRFVGIRHKNGPWICIFMKGSGKKIDFEKMGVNVELHGNGIEFLEDAP